MLLKIHSLFNEEALQKAWAARIERNDKTSEKKLIELCNIINSRVSSLPDHKSQKIIVDALQWSINNPHEISYNTKDKDSILHVSPNLVGFHFVMKGIASRILKKKIQALKIIVDQQTQFNKAQKSLSDFYSKNSKITLFSGFGLP